MRSILSAALVLGVLVPAHLLLPQEASVALGAVTLAVIAGAYIGFAAATGQVRALVEELGGASLFGIGALLGLLWHPVVIPVALILHAGWDLAHHSNLFRSDVPGWYIPFCVWVDIGLGAVLLALYLV